MSKNTDGNELFQEVRGRLPEAAEDSMMKKIMGTRSVEVGGKFFEVIFVEDFKQFVVIGPIQAKPGSAGRSEAKPAASMDEALELARASLGAQVNRSERLNWWMSQCGCVDMDKNTLAYWLACAKEMNEFYFKNLTEEEMANLARQYLESALSHKSERP